ncbi:MAG: hypothetical protein ACLVJ6_14800 [Merdibacter sp.]
MALDCVAAGIDKIRINPGNIGDDAHVRAVADMCGCRRSDSYRRQFSSWKSRSLLNTARRHRRRLLTRPVSCTALERFD